MLKILAAVSALSLPMALLHQGCSDGHVDLDATEQAENDPALIHPDEPFVQAAAGMRDVLLVGNSVAGTVSFIDARTFESLGSVNVYPDRAEMALSIYANPIRLVAYSIVKNQQLLHHFEPGAGDRYVDDV